MHNDRANGNADASALEICRGVAELERDAQTVDDPEAGYSDDRLSIPTTDVILFFSGLGRWQVRGEDELGRPETWPKGFLLF